jgi:ribosome maturation factor RimP
MDKEHIETLIRKDIEALGCDIWGLELIGSITNPTLRVFIDNDKGITIRDCEKVSKHISKVIESNTLYSNSLILEVSSPGIDRKFFNKEQYINYLGRVIKVRYRNEQMEYKSVKGFLRGVSKESIVIEVNNEESFISFEAIEKANLEFAEV